MIKYLVVHCSDTPDDRKHTAEDIHKWHKERGFDGIGYNAVIQRNGIIQNGRPEYWQGAHVKEHNSESLGVCLIGREQFTDMQFQSLLALLNDWKRRYPEALVVGHRDLDKKKTCPNFNAGEWYHRQMGIL